uniref:Phosphatidic acid phosphatase type 2/haloperoxidase domain-containing protein n=1 Tax=Ciona savignyi TaxID=51511 RepID=H2YLQ7_CIOSA
MRHRNLSDPTVNKKIKPTNTGHLKLLKDVDFNMSKMLAVYSGGGKMRNIMMLLELSGHGIPWLIGSIITIIITNNQLKEVYLNLLFALVLDLLMVATVKGVVRRPRPNYNQQDMLATVSLDLFSFPSGHATRATMVALFLLHHLQLTMFYNFFLIIWALSVCISRILLGRHYVFDVLCGIIIGCIQCNLVEQFWISYEFIGYIYA